MRLTDIASVSEFEECASGLAIKIRINEDHSPGLHRYILQFEGG